MISIYLFTNGISGMYVGWIPDAYGRKKTLLWSFGGSLLFQLRMVVFPNYWIRNLCYFGLAMMNVKNGCAFAWLFETSGTKNKQFVSTLVNAYDRSTLFCFGFVVLFVQRWWAAVALWYLILGILAWLTILLLIPESPNWLMINNRNDEAIDNLN